MGGVALLGRHYGRPLSVYVITGPNFRGVFSVPAGMRGYVQVTPYVGPRHCIYRDTTALVAPGGYNTVQELAYTGVPAVIVPGARDFDEPARALEAAADRLNVSIAKAIPEDIAQGLTEVMCRGVERPRCATPPRGAQEIADTVAAFAGRALRTCLSTSMRYHLPRFHLLANNSAGHSSLPAASQHRSPRNER